MSEKVFDSVEELVDSLSSGDAFAVRVKERLHASQVVTKLQAMRVAKGVPLSSIALDLGCSPRRVANIENGDDATLTIAEVEGYAKALGCAVHFDFV